LEAGVAFELVGVDFNSKQLSTGGIYVDINPKGQVPALMFDDGQVLTENVAVLSWVADRAPHLAPGGDLGRYRLLGALGFFASEIHKRFPIYLSLLEAARQTVAGDIMRWFGFAEKRLDRGYLFGEAFSVVDVLSVRHGARRRATGFSSEREVSRLHRAS
jgi:glutathione S-transferase